MSSDVRGATDFDIGSDAAELAGILDDPAVRELLDDRPETLELRPAMRTLTTDQRDLLAELIAGFDDRRSFVEWGLRALVHTLGEFSAEWIATALSSRADLSILIDEYPAPDTRPALNGDRAIRIRVALATADFVPACRDAQRRLRFKSREWTPGEYDGGLPDGKDQRHPGMMPALTEISERLTWALGEFLEGFESRTTLLIWYSETIEGSFVELDGGFVEQAILDRPALADDILIEPAGPEASELRLVLAADEVLPAAARAVDERIEHANEFVEEEQTASNRPSL
ncbi:hypothetical protein [Halobellus limi]|nr:hypothetical protein [Halobellus limi]SEF52115.1 hypothetical protein SAMN04488133_0026 [Halobellus limi]